MCSHLSLHAVQICDLSHIRSLENRSPVACRSSAINYSGARAALRAAKRRTVLIWETKGNPWVDFLMVIMATGIARGRVRTTTTTTTTVESRKMAAILQIIGWLRHAALVYCVLLWYWTSMLWSIDKVSTNQYRMSISRGHVYNSSRSSVFLKLNADLKLVFRLDRGLMSGLLVENRAGLFRSRLTLTQDKMLTKLYFFFFLNVFVAFSCIWWLLKLKTEGQTIYRVLNSNQNSTFS